MKTTHIIAGIILLVSSSANAALVSVTGGLSAVNFVANSGVLPEILAAAPADVNDDAAVNTGMQGFDEMQDIVTSMAYTIDGGGSIAAGTAVDSHMIFLNSQGGTRIDHEEVIWKFAGEILGVMSNGNGSYEVASSGELGAAGTLYPLAAFAARGLESNDSYSILGLTMLKVTMRVTEPGDWIRVITTASAVPVPAAIWLFGTALVGFIGFSRRRIVA